jgi:hypothetical protein
MDKDLKEWKDSDLITEAKALYGGIEVTECYGIKDLVRYRAVLGELERRGYNAVTSIEFYKE